MKKIGLLIIIILTSFLTDAQVRNGWKSIYDTSGRLVRMNYFVNGVNIIDSNYYYQYFTDNVIKGIIKGDMRATEGCYNGTMYLFNEAGNLTSFNIKREGSVIFNTTCDDNNVCSSSWVDQFEADTKCWKYDSASFSGSEMIINNSKEIGLAIYDPPVPIDIHNQFVFQVHFPKNNNAKQGVILGWKDSLNYYLIEVSDKDFFSILYYENGRYTPITDTRKPFEKKNDELTEIKIYSNGKSLIFEINQKTEAIIPLPNFKGEQIGLVTRSKGDAHFSDVLFKYPLPAESPFYTKKWIGKSTGFFISSTGKILTTYDAIADAKSLRIKGKKDGVTYIVPVKIVRTEEAQNLAILQVTDTTFESPFKELLFGYKDYKPLSESNAFSIGFPNATSGIYIEPEAFNGKVLPNSSTIQKEKLIEMPFRNGMVGAPVFDNDANLIGIVSSKGVELRYSEIVDFQRNARLIKTDMKQFDNSYDSPLKNFSKKDKITSLSNIVVIVESSIFNLDGNSAQIKDGETSEEEFIDNEQIEEED